MSTSEIQSWIATASMGEPSGSDEGHVWQRERVLADWTWALEHAQNVLLHEKSKERIRFLKDELLSLARHGGTCIVCLRELLVDDLTELSMAQIMDVFKLLTLTYPKYSDSASQDAVEAIGMELVRRDELRGAPGGAQDEVRCGVAEQIIGWLANEVGRLARRGNAEYVHFLLHICQLT